MDILRWPVECAHKAGVKIYARVDPYNLGGPSEYGYTSQVIFVKEHPDNSTGISLVPGPGFGRANSIGKSYL